MKKIILLALPLVFLSGCSFNGDTTSNEKFAILESQISGLSMQFETLRQENENIKTLLTSQTTGSQTAGTIFVTSFGSIQINFGGITYQQKSQNYIKFGDNYELTISAKKSKDDVLGSINSSSPTVVVKPIVKNIGGYEVIERSEGGMSYYARGEVLGNNANYSFTKDNVTEGKEQNDFDYIESIIASLKEI